MLVFKVTVMSVLTVSVVAICANGKPRQAEVESTPKLKSISAEHKLVELLSAKCRRTGRIAYIESDAKRIAVFNKEGQLILLADPAKELKLMEYRVRNEDRILRVAKFDENGILVWGYNSSQFGGIHIESGTVEEWGND